MVICPFLPWLLGSSAPHSGQPLGPSACFPTQPCPQELAWLFHLSVFFEMCVFLANLPRPWRKEVGLAFVCLKSHAAELHPPTRLMSQRASGSGGHGAWGQTQEHGKGRRGRFCRGCSGALLDVKGPSLWRLEPGGAEQGMGRGQRLQEEAVRENPDQGHSPNWQQLGDGGAGPSHFPCSPLHPLVWPAPGCTRLSL